MTRVLAIDAGESTGLAVVDFTESGPELRYLSQFVDDVYGTTITVYKRIEEYIIGTVVIEQFDLRPGNQFTADLSTVYRNGALEFMLRDEYGISPVWQTPAQAKGLVSDAVLKRFGPEFWPTGKTVGYKDANDARDALRHALRYGVEVLEHMPTIKKGWPREEET